MDVGGGRARLLSGTVGGGGGATSVEAMVGQTDFILTID
jgi:hypothetical protein